MLRMVEDYVKGSFVVMLEIMRAVGLEMGISIMIANLAFILLPLFINPIFPLAQLMVGGLTTTLLVAFYSSYDYSYDAHLIRKSPNPFARWIKVHKLIDILSIVFTLSIIMLAAFGVISSFMGSEVYIWVCWAQLVLYILTYVLQAVNPVKDSYDAII